MVASQRPPVKYRYQIKRTKNGIAVRVLKTVANGWASYPVRQFLRSTEEEARAAAVQTIAALESLDRGTSLRTEHTTIPVDTREGLIAAGVITPALPEEAA